MKERRPRMAVGNLLSSFRVNIFGADHWSRASPNRLQSGSLIERWACALRIVISPIIPYDSPPCYHSLMRHPRVEESTTGGRCSLAVSAVSSCVPV